MLEGSREHSAYFTSPELAVQTARILGVQESEAAQVIDPACGSGTLLRGVYEERLRTAILKQTDLPDIRSFFGCDIEPLSALLCKMNLWLAAAKKGRPIVNLDENIRTVDIWDAWKNTISPEENESTEHRSLISGIWPSIEHTREILFVANPPWGESSNEAEAVKKKQRKKISPEQLQSVSRASEIMKIDTLIDNLYLPFLLIPFWENVVNKSSPVRPLSNLRYAFILPDQVFVGTQRTELRRSIWPSIRKYESYSNNRDVHFEGSVFGDDPDPNMRFGILAGEMLAASRAGGPIKIVVPNEGKMQSLPRRCKQLYILPLFSSQKDIESWNLFFERDHELLEVSWQKGEVNRKGANRKIVEGIAKSTGDFALEVVCSSQGEWKKNLGKKINGNVLIQKLWTQPETRDDKKKILFSKRIVVPAQLSSGSSNTFENRVAIKKNCLITDNFHWIESNASAHERIKKLLESEHWGRISRAIATRRNMPVALLNELGLPDIILEVKKESA